MAHRSRNLDTGTLVNPWYLDMCTCTTFSVSLRLAGGQVHSVLVDPRWCRGSSFLRRYLQAGWALQYTQVLRGFAPYSLEVGFIVCAILVSPREAEGAFSKDLLPEKFAKVSYGCIRVPELVFKLKGAR